MIFDDDQPDDQVKPASEITARCGRALGNWNDRTFGTDGAADPRRRRRFVWRRLDRLASWLYVRGAQ
jgi:hypothetical protein